MSTLRRLLRSLLDFRQGLGTHWVEPSNEVTVAIDAGLAPEWAPVVEPGSFPAPAAATPDPAVAGGDDRGRVAAA